MIEEAINRIIELSHAEKIPHENRTYTDRKIFPVNDPTPNPVTIHTLTGLVDFINQRNNHDDIIHIVSPDQVRVVSDLKPVWMDRDHFATAEFLCALYPFGRYLPVDEFIVAIQAYFVSDKTTGKILDLVSTIHIHQSENIEDDGIIQNVATKRGARLKSESLPNPVKLRPYRTFHEVEQPTGNFVFRKHPDSVSFALFEAGCGDWKLTAIESIKNWLSEKLPDHVIIA